MFRFFTLKNLTLVALFFASVSSISAQSEMIYNLPDTNKPSFVNSFKINKDLHLKNIQLNNYEFLSPVCHSCSPKNGFTVEIYNALLSKNEHRIQSLSGLNDFNAVYNSNILLVHLKGFNNLLSAYAGVMYDQLMDAPQDNQIQLSKQAISVQSNALFQAASEMVDVFDVINEQSLVISSEKPSGNSRYSFYKRFLRIHI